MAFPLDRKSPDFHASYDAALLDAAIETSADLLWQLSSHRDVFGADRVNEWHVPWSIVPTPQIATTITLKDLLDDTSENLLRALREESILSASPPERDIQTFIRHWAFQMLFHSLPLHVQTRFQAEQPAAYNGNAALIKVRNAIKYTAKTGNPGTKSTIIVGSPAHPEWANYRAEQKTSSEDFAKSLALSAKVREFAMALLGKNTGPTEKIDDPACTVMQKAVPELFTVDRGHIAEIETPERTALQQRILEIPLGVEQLGEENKAVMDLLADLLVTIDPDLETAPVLGTEIATQHDEPGYSMIDDTAAGILQKFITPLLRQPNLSTELLRRLPILKYAILQVMLEKTASAETRTSVIDAINAYYETAPLADRMLEIYLLATKARNGEKIVANLRYSI